MQAEMYKEMVTSHEGEQPESFEGMYRLRCYEWWPVNEEDDDPEPTDRYYDNLERALLDYMSQVAQQVAENKLMEYVEVSVFNKYTHFYETQFASHQLHTVVSYGLEPKE